MKVEIKTLKNKSRKGDYVYIKEKGIRGKYYKYDINVPLEYFIERYKDSIKTNIKTKTYMEKTPTERAKKLVNKIKKQPRISKIIQKGRSEINREIQSSKDINPIQDYNKLFRRLVLDPKLMKVIIQNRMKLKSYITHQIDIYGIRGDDGSYGLLGTLKYQNMSIEKMKESIEGLKNGMNVSSKILEQFKATKTENKKEGIVKHIKLKTYFVKG